MPLGVLLEFRLLSPVWGGGARVVGGGWTLPFPHGSFGQLWSLWKCHVLCLPLEATLWLETFLLIWLLVVHEMVGAALVLSAAFLPQVPFIRCVELLVVPALLGDCRPQVCFPSRI